MMMRRETHFGRVVPCFIDRPPTVDAMFRSAAGIDPSALAVVDSTQRLTYVELDQLVERLAAGLMSLGVGKGDRLATLIGNQIAFVALSLACARVGIIHVPLNTRQRKQEIEYALNQSGAVVLVHEVAMAAEVPAAEAVPNLRVRFVVDGISAGAQPYERLMATASSSGRDVIGEDDPFCILYTSGTTGRPKGAILSNLGAVHSSLNYHYGLGLTAADRMVLAVPAAHVTGLIAIVTAILGVGGCLIMMPYFKARLFLELVERERATATLMVPAMYNLCLLDPDFDRFDLSSWKVGAFGGAPMPEATARRVKEKSPGLMLFNVYGSTETTSPVTISPKEARSERLDSVGKVLPTVDVRMMDDDGLEVPVGQPGELWIAGATVIPGYWNNPEADVSAFAGGYWKSGDIGSVDADGYVRILDRKKDMINRAGYKIYSAEVEDILSYHPSIAEVAVVGYPDPVLGERVEAFVVVRAATSADELRRFCAERLSDYKVPDRITFMEGGLPRNPNGKLLKSALRGQNVAPSVQTE